MRVIVWGINYAPEPTGIAPYNTDLCEFLAERGHAVEMVSSFRYYPQWERLPGDGNTLYRTDRIGRVDVHRCWCYLAKQPRAYKRILHELSFCLTSFIRVLCLKRPDLVIVISPPLALGFFAWLACLVKRTRFVFHVQDLQPDAAVGLGMLKPSLLTRALYRLEAFAYAKASRVSSISAGILEAFAQKGVPKRKRMLFPNWLRQTPEDMLRGADATRARSKYGIPQDALLAVYSGNIGKKQNLSILCEAGRLLSTAPAVSREIVLMIAGDGAGRAQLEADLAQSPAPRVRLLPLLDDDDYKDMLAATDISLITQAPGTGQYFFPSKLLSSLCARVPVIAVADETSELAQAVREGAFGTVIAADQPALLADCLRRLACKGQELRQWKKGTHWVDRFARNVVLSSFEHDLTSLVSEPRH